MGDAGHDRDLWKQRCERAEAEKDAVTAQLEHHRSELNRVLHPGNDGPKRPSLCDLVAYVEGDFTKLRIERDKLAARVGALEQARDEWRGRANRATAERNGLIGRVDELEKALCLCREAIATITSLDGIHWMIDRSKITAADNEVREALGGGGLP